MGYSPWGRKESDTTEQVHFLFFFLRPLKKKKKNQTSDPTQKPTNSLENRQRLEWTFLQRYTNGQ